MNVLLVGTEDNKLLFEEKFSGLHQVHLMKADDAEFPILQPDVVFHFRGGQHLSEVLEDFDCPVFVECFSHTLAELLYVNEARSASQPIIGFCGLAGLFSRDIMEVCVTREKDLEALPAIFKWLNTDFEVVEDRVGLVTPRILLMIINEAFYTVQEGVATKSEIDIAMKTGTNYPYGPFEWVRIFGIEVVYVLMESIYEATKNERYRPCELLTRTFFQDSGYDW